MINLLENTLNLFEAENKNSPFIVDPLIGTLFLTIKKYNESDKSVLIYAHNTYEANNLYQKIINFIPKENVVYLPSNDLIRVEYISESKELKSELIYGLYRIKNEKHLVVIATVSSAIRFYPTIKTFDSSFINFKVGQTIDLEKVKKDLAKIGYTRVNKIDQSLEYAFRGGVIDIFSLNYENPIRIELFDDEIESIRLFNIETQTSYEKINECVIIPASINLLSDDEINKCKNKILNQLESDSRRIKGEDFETLKSNTENDLNDILTLGIDNKNYKYYGFLQDIHTSLIDFLPNCNVIVTSKDDFEKSKEMLIKETNNFLLELQSNYKCISRLEYFNTRASLFTNSNSQSILNQFYLSKEDVSIPVRSVQELNQKEKNTQLIIKFYYEQRYKLLLIYSNEGEKNLLENCLNNLEIDYASSDKFEVDENKVVTISSSKIDISLEFTKENIVVLSSDYLFTKKGTIKTYTTKFKEGKILETYEDLEPGDYVVHEKYGIGKFSKIETIEINGKHNDYIEILYANDDKLYVPLYQFNLIRKYVGKEGSVPRLTNIGTKQREKTKKKIKEKINDLADRLLSLYQERAKIPGYAFEKDDDIQKSFEISFSHNLTNDQKKCVEEIKEDMEKPHPMDRLLCGDVGFGKTEVALEAAMKAILSGKQVCFLCPTTLLAMQHFKVATERFKDFPVKIEILTRMVTPQQEKNIKELLKDGKIDLLIGTHKVLSKEVVFKDLGLLIIDEEQRFGVEQKEKIKEMHKNIDVLTLSATPIPRTLQSSLVGLKSISTIETPPEGRFPIQTYVINYDEGVIKEIIQRELGRNGQVYYLYNDIALLNKKALILHKLVPNARIGIVHARMNKEDIDSVMTDFYEGNIDILLATTIIENGIDVTNANLLLVENADRFGLAQLYQIKGRVGRGDRMAFAYLMIKQNKEITEDAKKRLKAIQDFTELGSGYKIAQRDLLIRGAGDILGPEQAGFVDSVGIDMYIRLLNETMAEKKGEKIAQNNIKSLNTIDGFIPKNFAKNDEKLEIYQKILQVTSIGMLNDLKANITDQFGKLPESVAKLFIKRSVDIYLAEEEFKSYNEYPKYVKLVLSDKFSSINGIGTSLFTALLKYINKIKMSYKDGLINIDIDKNGDWVDTLLNILSTVHQVYISQRKVKIVDEN